MCDTCPAEYELSDEYKLNNEGVCEGYCCKCSRYENCKLNIYKQI